jgi:hypothetical protein
MSVKAFAIVLAAVAGLAAAAAVMHHPGGLKSLQSMVGMHGR